MPATATPAFAISATTVKILKNFAGISNSILLTEGKVQKSLQASKSLFAIAEFPEAWPQETGIFNLSGFLGALTLLKNPHLEFTDDSFVITDANSRIRYRYSDPSTILVPPAKTLQTDNPQIQFDLSQDALSQLNKTCALLELNTITMSVEGGDVVIRAADEKNPASHAYEYTVPAENVTGDLKKRLSIAFKQEHLALLLEGGYRVSLGWTKYGFFKHATDPVSYFVVAQA